MIKKIDIDNRNDPWGSDYDGKASGSSNFADKNGFEIQTIFP